MVVADRVTTRLKAFQIAISTQKLIEVTQSEHRDHESEYNICIL